jgi:hypothetical protein
LIAALLPAGGWSHPDFRPRQAFRHQAALERLAGWLRAELGHDDLAAALAHFRNAKGRMSGASAPLGSLDPSRNAESISERIRQDFLHGRILLVNRIQMSCTEIGFILDAHAHPS